MTGRRIMNYELRVLKPAPLALTGYKRLLCKSVIALICLVVSTAFSFSQDIHFTQFFSNPLILNPAQTGNFNGNYRVGFNFRGEWPWAIGNSSPYNYHTESPYV